MKKLSLILVLMLALTIVFAACNQVDTTNAYPRWTNDEYTFDITLANTKENPVTVGDNKYYRHPTIRNYEMDYSMMDQLVPEDVSGKFTMKIELSSDELQCTFSTTQVLYLQYKTSVIDALDSQVKSELPVIAADSVENPFANHNGLTTLKSTTETWVVFKNEASQRPLSSHKELHGFYLGKEHQEISNYTVDTIYNWEGKKLQVQLNGDEKLVSPEGNYTDGKLIDVNQALLYIRSLEKTSGKFADNPSVYVYSPEDNKISSASFAFTSDCKTIIKNNGEDTLVSLNAVGMVAGGAEFLIQMNLPHSINEKASVDTVSLGGSSAMDKFTTVRFRVGVFAYELESYKPNWISALTAPKED